MIGGFGSLFDLSNLTIKDPVIVSCTDGVGTKIDLANKFKKFDTIGVDLAAMHIHLIKKVLATIFRLYCSEKLDLKKLKKI